jgi:hypothetical protein
LGLAVNDVPTFNAYPIGALIPSIRQPDTRREWIQNGFRRSFTSVSIQCIGTRGITDVVKMVRLPSGTKFSHGRDWALALATCSSLSDNLNDRGNRNLITLNQLRPKNSIAHESRILVESLVLARIVFLTALDHTRSRLDHSCP